MRCPSQAFDKYLSQGTHISLIAAVVSETEKTSTCYCLYHRAGSAPHTMLLTGPNMGGKSTLLRAACCAVILAQMGCPVPADSAVISITDRIFTRLGRLQKH